MIGETSIALAPLLPWTLIGILGAAGALVVVLATLRRARGAVWRLLAIAVLVLALLNPSFVVEEREPLKDIAVIVVDETQSQSIGKRAERTKTALDHARKALARFPNIETRVVRVRGGSIREGEGTRLFSALEKALGDISRRRLAGVLMISDGQIHDVPALSKNPKTNRATGAPILLGRAPLHVMITGDRRAGDRRLALVKAPSYGLVGKPLSMTVKVEDLPNMNADEARITIKRDGKPWQTVTVPVGRPTKLEFRLEHAGPTYFELEVEAAPRELTMLNNRVVVSVSGVRDRLRVLLVSGEPHPGERSWRNLLKSDPAVDLVHFTILRPPEKQDLTPVHELSLISFPVRELFDLKLKEFDLIIFDRYRRRGVLLSTYLRNIAKYVDEGGALLVAVGPQFASPLTLYNTPLGAVLPGKPTGQVLTRGFRPDVSTIGGRHPVSAGLKPPKSAKPWGRWFRQIEVATGPGHTLMNGIEGRPLLVLNRVGKGRVAQLLSDQIWLWGRGYDGGGPQAELMRRLAHWLMKEPELEENDLRATIRDGRLEVIRRSLEKDDRPVTVTMPSGKTKSLKLEELGDGRARAILPVDRAGLYRVGDGTRTAIAAAGALNALEMADVRATDEKLKPIVTASGGGVVWMAEQALPELRMVRTDRTATGRSGLTNAPWLGFRTNRDYVVTGIRDVPLLPAILVLLLGLSAIMLAWRREGK
ncbi:MAG: hypothetical protein OEQ29_17970 [Alphaproteobacteria bacterium]|nr:hypothetical protein [Alphaproteobacteria bacterium]